jgi:hypothetical protein
MIFGACVLYYCFEDLTMNCLLQFEKARLVRDPCRVGKPSVSGAGGSIEHEFS